MKKRSKACPRGRVRTDQMLCLQQNAPFLVRELDAPLIAEQLFSLGVIDENDRDKILGVESKTHSRDAQNRQLINIISNRTSDGFDTFLQALDDTGHERAAKRLKDTLSGEMSTKTKNHMLADDLSAAAAPSHVERIDDQEEDDEVFHHKQSLDDSGENSSPRKEACRFCGRVDDVNERVDAIPNGMMILRSREEELKILQNELQEAAEEMLRLQDENISLKLKMGRHEKENKELLQQFEQRTFAIEKANVKIAELEKKVKTIERENAALLSQSKSQKERLEQIQIQTRQLQSDLKTQERNFQKQKFDMNKGLNKLDQTLQDEKLERAKQVKEVKRENESSFNFVMKKMEKLEMKVGSLDNAEKAKPMLVRENHLSSPVEFKTSTKRNSANAAKPIPHSRKRDAEHDERTTKPVSRVKGTTYLSHT